MSYLSLLKGSISLTVGGMDKLIAAGVNFAGDDSELTMLHDVPLYGARIGGTGLWHHPVKGVLLPTPDEDEAPVESRNYALSDFMALADRVGAISACNLTRTGEDPGDWEQWHQYGPGCGGVRHWHSIKSPVEREQQIWGQEQRPTEKI